MNVYHFLRWDDVVKQEAAKRTNNRLGPHRPRRSPEGFGPHGRSATTWPSRRTAFNLKGSGLVGARPLRGRRGEPAPLPTLRRCRTSAGSGLVGARPLRGRRGERALPPTLRRRRTRSSAANTGAQQPTHTQFRMTKLAFRRLRRLQDMASAPLWGGAPATSCVGGVGRHVGRLLRRFRDSRRSARGVVGPREGAPRAAFNFAAH